MMNPQKRFQDKGRDAVINLESTNDVRAKRDEVEFLCFGLDACPKLVQSFMLTVGIFVTFIIYGYLQELIFRLDGIKPFGWYLTLVQFGFYSVFGFFETRIRRDTVRKIPWKTYVLLAFVTVATMALSNSSVGYLNYPTQVMFKCCKLIPVLIGSIVIQGKMHGALDFVAAGFMSLGLIFFTLADVHLSPNFDPIGVGMISLALVADAVIGNVQEKAMKEHQASNTEVVLYSYSIGFVLLVGGAFLSGQWFRAFEFFALHPLETYGYISVFSITGYLGIQLVLGLIVCTGAFVAVTVTTCRKAVTIILSFIFFTKPFSFQYLWSALLVLLGIYINIMGKKASFQLSESWMKRLFEGMKQRMRQNIREKHVALEV